MVSTCLLDSRVIINIINGRNGRAELLQQLIDEGTLLACCSINITEVYMGLRSHETEKTESFLASLEFFPVTPEVAKFAGALYRTHRRKGVTLALPELTIAAVAISYKRNSPRIIQEIFDAGIAALSASVTRQIGKPEKPGAPKGPYNRC